jgi:hypothetical protein
MGTNCLVCKDTRLGAKEKCRSTIFQLKRMRATNFDLAQFNDLLIGSKGGASKQSCTCPD